MGQILYFSVGLISEVGFVMSVALFTKRRAFEVDRRSRPVLRGPRIVLDLFWVVGCGLIFHRAGFGLVF